MSKDERKAYNQGKRDGKQIGYMEGYAQGLHDGNPFNALIDAFASIAKTIAENPELLQQLNQEELIIEGDDEE
jgi:flagellar biosynthesis/type III secretory pathway protein FliH